MKHFFIGFLFCFTSLFVNGQSQNVGIGLPAPSARLHVMGAGSNATTFSLKIDNSLNSPLFYVRDNGRIGIGSNNPLNTFSIGLTSQFQVDATGNMVKIKNVNYDWPSANATANGQVLTSTTSGALYWSTPLSGSGSGWSLTGTPATNLTFQGYVGIGTITPTTPLHIRGAYGQSTPKIITLESEYDGDIFQTYILNSLDAQMFEANGGFQFRFNPSSSPKMVINYTYAGFFDGLVRTTNDFPQKPTGGSWTGYSDKRLKKEILPFNDGLSVIRKINPINYKFNGIGGLSSTENHIGVAAQDVQDVVPYCIKSSKMQVKKDEADVLGGTKRFIGKDTLAGGLVVEKYETDVLMYNMDGLFYVMLNSIKELDAKNTELVTRLTEMEDKFAKMQKRLDKLENK